MDFLINSPVILPQFRRFVQSPGLTIILPVNLSGWHRLTARFYHLRGMAHRHLGHLQGDREEYRLAVADFTRAVQRRHGDAGTRRHGDAATRRHGDVEGESVKDQQMQMKEIVSRLRHLMGFRAALAPFRATLHALDARIEEPEGRRSLLILWRPCQERLDLLLDVTPQNQSWAVQMRLLREEIEDTLLDESYNPSALKDLIESLDQVCEGFLFEAERELSQAMQDPLGKGGSNEPGV